MAITTRQSNLFAAEDWKKLYSTFRTADFQSYDFETLRKSMVDYLRTYYPEDFNDYIESSEFIALLDLISFMGQSITFRSDLNARENFMETAERRDSVYRLAKLLGYSPNRCKSASGVLKIISVSTSELVTDSSGRNLANVNIQWDDPTNIDWFEQFTTVINSALQPSQKVGRPSGSVTIGSVKHDLYQFRLRDNIVPIFSFSGAATGAGYPFEVYSIALDDELGITELPPTPSDSMGFVYRSDGRGNASVNTGFFLGFKQGQLTNLDFTLSEALSNRIVGLNVNNINNSDVWLFSTNDAGSYTKEWTQVPNLRDSNVIYNSQSKDNRTLYSVTSRANDQIDLVFGDGVFADVPVGSYRAVVRVSNGLSYNISPQDLRSVAITIPYISRSGKIEGLIVRASLQYTVSNAVARETLASIKERAPQYYYTQNRMVNGEDYNTLPNSKFTDIAKVKAVNRTASGLSRYLDITDPTSKYSSTNFFGDDGYLYKEEDKIITEFSYTTASDVQRFIKGELADIISSKESLHLYYDKFPKGVLPTNLVWKRVITGNDNSNGYFALVEGSTYSSQSVGPTGGGNRQLILPNSLVKFEAPSGKYFDIDRSIKTGTPTKPGQATSIWTTVLSVIDDGTVVQDDGNGPVVLNENIPTDARATYVYAPYGQRLEIGVEQQILQQILNNLNFGLRYDHLAQTWKLVTAANLKFTDTVPEIDPYSAIAPAIVSNDSLNMDVTEAGDTSSSNKDNSWSVAFITSDSSGVNGSTITTYQVHRRRLNYYFGSVYGTRFYFDGSRKIYDTKSATVIRDGIKILRTNSKPDSNTQLEVDYLWQIHDSIRYDDGYKDDTLVKITFADSDDDSVPDDPELFSVFVDDVTNPLTKKVFLQKYLDFDNLDRYRWLSPDDVTTSYATVAEISTTGVNANPIGTVFYATSEDAFYVSAIVDDLRVATLSTDYKLRNGRNGIYFQYKHNAPSDRRIDPSPTNIIDMYVLPTNYDKEYRRWVADTTGTVNQPVSPSVVDLTLAYSDLLNYKTVSDAIIFNPASFRLLFGSKADTNLQATFKIVKSPGSRMSNNELRSNVLSVINQYFAIDNWDFGDIFYYSELAAYIHNQMSPDLASIVIVPRDSSLAFGSLFQVTSQPNEIFLSAATVDDIEIVDALTASRLRASTTSVIFSGTQTTLGSNT